MNLPGPGRDGFYDNKVRFLYREFKEISWGFRSVTKKIRELSGPEPKRKIFALVIQRKGYPEDSGELRLPDGGF